MEDFLANVADMSEEATGLSLRRIGQPEQVANAVV
jgi:hypothetical protein